MAVMPNTSATCMAQLMRDGTEVIDSFHGFFECWLVQQNQNLQELVNATTNNANQNATTSTVTESTPDHHEEGVLRPLIDRVVQHYDHYYRAKSSWVKNHVLATLSPSWLSTLENAYLWIGGWRPSMAFHLLYSKSGLQLEARLTEFLQGISMDHLGDLSSSQLSQVDELQRKTIREEREISEKMAKTQETVADSKMVELSNTLSELMRSNEANQDRVGQEEDRVNRELASKKGGLEKVLLKADDLRLRTLRQVIDILTSIQAVHYLIAAAELHLRLHDWGKKMDAQSESGLGNSI